MTPNRVPLTAIWWPDDSAKAQPKIKTAELELAFDGNVVSIYGLRPGRHVSVEFVELLAAVVLSERGLAPPPAKQGAAADPPLDAAA